jgi:hypothetical protein
LRVASGGGRTAFFFPSPETELEAEKVSVTNDLPKENARIQKRSDHAIGSKKKGATCTQQKRKRSGSCNWVTGVTCTLQDKGRERERERKRGKHFCDLGDKQRNANEKAIGKTCAAPKHLWWEGRSQ